MLNKDKRVNLYTACLICRPCRLRLESLCVGCALMISQRHRCAQNTIKTRVSLKPPRSRSLAESPGLLYAWIAEHPVNNSPIRFE